MYADDLCSSDAMADHHPPITVPKAQVAEPVVPLLVEIYGKRKTGRSSALDFAFPARGELLKLAEKAKRQAEKEEKLRLEAEEEEKKVVKGEAMDEEGGPALGGVSCPPRKLWRALAHAILHDRASRPPTARSRAAPNSTCS